MQKSINNIDKIYKRVNFYVNGKRLTRLNIYNLNLKTDFLLSLFDVGYKNAYFSTMDFVSNQNNNYNRIELVLPNVGRLCLYQTFIDVLDEQVPHFDIFYYDDVSPNIRTKITDIYLSQRATRIIYKAKKFFESNPGYIRTSDDLIKVIKSNQNMLYKQYKKQIEHN